MNYRYFLIKEKGSPGDVEIVHETTEAILSDVFTKPQKGTQYKKI